MSSIWFIGFLFTFIGIAIGGFIAIFISGFSKSIGMIYAACSGLILALLSFEIAPEAIQLGNWGVFSIGFLVGIIVFRFLHTIIGNGSEKQKRTVIFLALAIAFHNYPMGFILGASERFDFSAPFLKAIVLHNIPEGMILFTPLFFAKRRIISMFTLSIIVCIPVALGAYMGRIMGMQNELIWAFLMSLVVGTIYMVTMKEILPESIKHSSNSYTVSVALVSFLLLGAYLVLI